MLQETRSTLNDEKNWRKQCCGNFFFSHGTSNSMGVLVGFREVLDYSVNKEVKDNNGRILILDVEIQGKPYLIINPYADNDQAGQLVTLAKLESLLKSFEINEEHKIILGGNFNIIFDTHLDADGGSPCLKVGTIQKLMDIISEYDLCDIFRVRNPDLCRFSWRQKTPLIQHHLDYIFISSELQEDVSEININPSIGSDHSILHLNISLNKHANRGTGYWKFNNSLLQDKSFVEKIKSHIQDVTQETSDLPDPRVKWEFLKYKIRFCVRIYAKEKAAFRRARRSHLEEKIKLLESAISSDSGAEILYDYSEAKTELEKVYNHIAEGIILRSRAQWYEEGEKSTSYFLRLEKRNKSKSHIRKLILDYDSDNEVVDDTLILQELKKFYCNLYSRRSVKTEEQCLTYLANINTPKLLENETLQCEGKLTLKECWNALVSMGSNKSPRNDGITKEFYVCFFAEVGSLLVSALNFCHDKGELTSSQKQAVITLIEKSGKDKRFIKNWRQISLLNIDVKIASKALAVRLKKVINKLIAYDQTAYVQGRYIGESTRVIQDLIDFADLKDQEGLIFSSDLEKAFDSVDHNFLFSVLRKFGFGPSFIQWVKTLLCKLKSCVMNAQQAILRCIGERDRGIHYLHIFSFLFWKFSLYRLDLIRTFSDLLLKTYL